LIGNSDVSLMANHAFNRTAGRRRSFTASAGGGGPINGGVRRNAQIDGHPRGPPAFFDTLVVYFQAFAERDPVRRGELLARCLTVGGEL
jgi:hypothetical protein